MNINHPNGQLTYSLSDESDNIYILDNVIAHEKRKGTGTELVNELISLARSEGKGIELCAYPQDDSIELSDLIRFYENLGFSVDYDDGNAVLMSL